MIDGALAAEGPLTRSELRDRLDEAGVPTAGQALIHLLALASLRGFAIRGPMRGHEHAYVRVHDWLGEQPPIDRGRALAELARRYLAGHGPADERDLSRWAGLPLRDARAGLVAIASLLEERTDGLVDLAGRVPAAPLPPPRLLGSYDPVLLGWTSRAELLRRHERQVVAEGLFRPFALADGRAIATWRLVRGQVALEPFARLARQTRAALELDGEDVVRFLDA